MLKYLLVAASIVLVPASANAIERYNIGRMSCDNIHAVLKRDHAAILRHIAPGSGLLLYDRYVSDNRYCPAYTSAVTDYLPSADNPSCPVYHCLNDDELPTGWD